MIHITHNRRILCHLQNGGMVFTINMQEASGMNPTQLCPDCLRRHQAICKMIGLRYIGKPSIDTVEKRVIIDTMRSHASRIKIEQE